MGKLSKPKKYGGLFFLIILIFAVVYALFPSAISGINHFGNALYFSIVTITTLGFGDVTPANGWGQFLVCLEAITGVVLIGLFLNSISEAQAQKVNEQEMKRQLSQRQQTAKIQLLQYSNLLNGVIQRYLIALYNVTTPIEKRNDSFPEDIFKHQFTFTFNDMYDLYHTSLMMTEAHYKPAIAIFFEAEERLYQELSGLLKDVDLTFFPKLEKDIQNYLAYCNKFAFKGAILEIGGTTIKNKTAEFCSKLIKEHTGELEMRPSNLINQFIALYYYLQLYSKLVPAIAEGLQVDSAEKPGEIGIELYKEIEKPIPSQSNITTDFKEWLAANLDGTSYDDVYNLYQSVLHNDQYGTFNTVFNEEQGAYYVCNDAVEGTLLLSSDDAKKNFLNLIESTFCGEMNIDGYYAYHKGMEKDD